MRCLWLILQPRTAHSFYANSAPPDPGLGLGLSPRRRRILLCPTQGSDLGSAPEDDDLRLARPRGSDPTSASEDSNELGVGFKVTSGPVLDKPGDLAGVLTSLEPNDVLFIDEYIG